MKRVLFVIHYPFFGGPHNQALRLDAALREHGWGTIVALPDEPGNAAERLEAAGIEVLRLPLPRLRALPDPRVQARFALSFAPTVGLLRREINRLGASLVQIAGLVNPHAAVAARRAGVPVVWQIVDSRAPGPLRTLTLPLVHRYADAVMFDGEALIPLHGGRGGFQAPVHVYYPPVDTSVFAPSAHVRAEMRTAHGIPIDAEVVGTVANINPQKGLEYFVGGAAIIAQRRPDVRFVLVGAEFETQREYSARLRALVRNRGIPESNFVFAGERSDVEHWYPLMDVNLITSVPRSEGTTTTAMEAMACGVPVIATDVAAVHEVVAHEVTGLLVPPCDEKALADAVLRLLDDPPLRERFALAGRQRAVDQFDVATCAEVHAAAYAAALEHASTRAPRMTLARSSLRRLRG